MILINYIISNYNIITYYRNKLKEAALRAASDLPRNKLP